MRMFRFGLILWFLGMGVGMAATADEFLYGQTTAANGSMPYRYFVPPTYDAGHSYPLILFLHGAGERGSDNEQQLANYRIYITGLMPMASSRSEFQVFPRQPQDPCSCRPFANAA